jgi:hypothetical protein
MALWTKIFPGGLGVGWQKNKKTERSDFYMGYGRKAPFSRFSQLGWPAGFGFWSTHSPPPGLGPGQEIVIRMCGFFFFCL